MSESKIEWTERTWNPIVGCSIVSPGCTHCYAMRMAARLQEMNRPDTGGARHTVHYDGTTKKVNGNIVWTGKLARAPERILLEPLKRKAPTTYFVNSMGDLFHEDCPDEWIDRVFAVMALCPQHTFQVLTKRADRMCEYVKFAGGRTSMARRVNLLRGTGLGDPDSPFTWPMKNVWLGVSAERQQEADERIPHLLQTPAAVRFVSAEPLLGPIAFDRIAVPSSLGGTEPSLCQLDWIIVGGESGPNARPMHPNWARSIRDQCATAGIAYFFKQWGEFKPGQYFQSPIRVGKKAAGRLLDGKEHNDFPRVTA
jgi:protein gp37